MCLFSLNIVVERFVSFGTTKIDAIFHYTSFEFYVTFQTRSLVIGNFAGGRPRHAFIGIGFRERTEAYDFQAALHDHMKYP